MSRVLYFDRQPQASSSTDPLDSFSTKHYAYNLNTRPRSNSSMTLPSISSWYDSIEAEQNQDRHSGLFRSTSHSQQSHNINVLAQGHSVDTRSASITRECDRTSPPSSVGLSRHALSTGPYAIASIADDRTRPPLRRNDSSYASDLEAYRTSGPSSDQGSSHHDAHFSMLQEQMRRNSEQPTVIPYHPETGYPHEYPPSQTMVQYVNGLLPAAAGHRNERYLGVQVIDGQRYHMYEGGKCLPYEINGERVNEWWGLTKANIPRKRLATACNRCRDKKIRCEPGEGGCTSCRKSRQICQRDVAPSDFAQ